MQAALGRSMRVKGLRRLSYPMVPLNEALPQFAEGSVRSSPVVTSRTRDAAAITRAITQLRSGLTVASESAFGQFCAVGGESCLITECLCAMLVIVYMGA